MTATQAPAELELRDYVSVLWRRKWVVALAVLVVAGTALALSVTQTPRYRASTEVLVRQGGSALVDPNASSGSPAVAQRTLENELRLARSRSVQIAAEDALGFDPDVSVRADANADVLTISATSTDPDVAAAVANSYAEVFIAERRESLVAEYLATAATIQDQVDVLDAEIEALRAERDAALAAVPADAVDRDAQLAAITQEYDTRIAPLQTERTRFVQLISNLDLSAQLAQGGGAQVISVARTPDGPFEPTTRQNAAIGVIVGLMLGVGAAFLLEYLDRSLRSEDDLQMASGLPTLAIVPELKGWKKGDHPHVISKEDPQSSSAEAYRGLRTSVQFLAIDRPIRAVQLTSPKPGDGKTTTSANLAYAVARAGQRVVLIDCDLRKPRIHEYFDLPNDRGFTTVLLGEARLDEVAHKLDDGSGLVVIPSGPVPPDPSELLSGRRARNLLETLRDEVDLLVIDSPPVLAVSDPLVLSTVADGVVLVASAGNTDRDQVTRAVEALRTVDAPVLGTVLNRFASKRSGSYGYGYGYGGYGTYGTYTAPAPAPNGQAHVEDRTASLDDFEPEDEPRSWRRFTRR